MQAKSTSETEQGGKKDFMQTKKLKGRISEK
jgi:hypothetical protein